MSGVRRFVVHGRNTANLDRALGFYRDALGCRVIDMHGAVPRWARLLATMPARCAGLALGNERIELLEFAACTPYPALPAASDPWFQHCAIVVSDMEAAHRHVVDLGGVRITRGGPQLLPPGNGSVTAFKFRDPDGHPLELIAFPAGSGDPEWQARRKQAVTLGIDHSAICVADSARSIAFYELLGFRVVARTVNHGGAQERLDGLPGVEVEVIAMQASARTPHLELLAYRHPRGRPASCDEVTAIAADRLTWRTAGVGELLRALRQSAFGNSILATGRVDAASVAMLRDPDGHLVVLLGQEKGSPPEARRSAAPPGSAQPRKPRSRWVKLPMLGATRARSASCTPNQRARVAAY